MKFGTTEQYHRVRGLQKQVHLASMANGPKKPDDKAREWFKRPAYDGVKGVGKENSERSEDLFE